MNNVLFVVGMHRVLATSLVSPQPDSHVQYFQQHSSGQDLESNGVQLCNRTVSTVEST